MYGGRDEDYKIQLSCYKWLNPKKITDDITTFMVNKLLLTSDVCIEHKAKKSWLKTLSIQSFVRYQKI